MLAKDDVTKFEPPGGLEIEFCDWLATYSQEINQCGVLDPSPWGAVKSPKWRTLVASVALGYPTVGTLEQSSAR